MKNPFFTAPAIMTVIFGMTLCLHAEEAAKPPLKFSLEISTSDRAEWIQADRGMIQCMIGASIDGEVNHCKELRVWLQNFAARVQQAKPVE